LLREQAVALRAARNVRKFKTPHSNHLETTMSRKYLPACALALLVSIASALPNDAKAAGSNSAALKPTASSQPDHANASHTVQSKPWTIDEFSSSSAKPTMHKH
jgi:hypothetical protein